MRRNFRSLPVRAVVLVAVVGSGLRVQAQNAPDRARPAPAAVQAPAPAPPADPRKLDELLKLWEDNSSKLTTLDVTMTRTDKSDAWGELENYEGRAILKSPNYAWLNFKKIVEEEDPKTKKKTRKIVDHERIICTGTEVWQYMSPTQQIFIYPLGKDQQQRALEEGPLPFLFNFKAAEAQKRYRLELISEDEDKVVLRIVPKLDIDSSTFKTAMVQLNRKFYLLPTRIYLIAPDGKSSKDFVLTLTEKSPNQEVIAANFQGQIIKGWKIIRNPGGDAPAAAARPAQQPAPVATKPAATTQPGQTPAPKRGLGIFRRN
jgi:TIGR03009 family protein